MKMTTDEFDEILESMKEPKKVWLTVEEAKAIAFDLKFLKSFVQFCPSEVKERIAQFESRIEQAEGYIPINNASFMEGKLILPKQAEGKE